MAKILTFPNLEEQEEQFSIEEDDKGFVTILNEHPEVKALFKRRHLYPDILEINGLNPVFHVMIEGIIENQLSDEIGVREIYEKLQTEEGLTPHAARACIARVFIIDFFAVLKEHKPFELEAYVRRLNLIGTEVSNLGRNDRCPCGSGAKYKRCCAPYAEAFEIFHLAGRLNLGYGSYVLDEPQDIQDPLDPIFQLEARYHISEYMETHADFEGALEVLNENIALARFYQDGEFLENAWQDYMFYCQNHVQFAEEGLKASEVLLELAEDDEEKGILICEKADFLATMGNFEAAETEYTKLFNSLPDFHFGRFRYALMLSEHKRESDAKKFLIDLLTNYRIDAETYEEAMALLEDLGEDTTEFDDLF
ncbi:SEC-C domain-containing protein [Desulfosporosinus fructosivorans]